MSDMRELPPVLKTAQKPQLLARNTPQPPANKAARPTQKDDVQDVKNANSSENNAETNKIEQADVDFLNILAEQDMANTEPNASTTPRDSSIKAKDNTAVDGEMANIQMPISAFTDDQPPLLNLNLAAEQTLTPKVETKPEVMTPITDGETVDPIVAAFTTQVATSKSVVARNGVSDLEKMSATAASTMPLTLNGEDQQILVQASAKTASATQQVEINIASNDNVDANAEQSIVSETKINHDKPMAEKLLSQVAEHLQKSGAMPEQVTKIIGKIEKILASAKSEGLGATTEKLMNELGALLNQDSAQIDDKLKQILGKMAAAFGLKQTVLSADAKATEGLAEANSNGKADDAPKAEAKHADAPRAKTLGTEQALQNTPPPVAAEVSKYANRYNKGQTTENSEINGEVIGNSDEPISSNKMASIYNGVKAGVAHTQNASNIMSALDRMNEKSPMEFLNQLQAGMSNQPLDPNQADSVVNIKLAMQNGKLAQNVPLNSMAFQMSKQFNRGNSEFQIRLDPAELGRINVKLTVKQGGNVKAHMVVERNDVFELMQRDARALERALSEAGFDGEKVEIELSLDQNAQNGGTFAENFFDQPQDQKSGGHNNDNNAPVDDEIVNVVASHIPLHVTSTGIDRKI